MSQMEHFLPAYIQKYYPLLSKTLSFKIEQIVKSIPELESEELNDYRLWLKVVNSLIAKSPDLLLTDHWFALIAAETLYANSLKEFQTIIKEYTLSPPLKVFSLHLPITADDIDKANQRLDALSKRYLSTSTSGQGLLEIAISYRLFNSIVYYYRRYNQIKRIWDEIYHLFLDYDKTVKNEYSEHSDLILEWRAAVLTSLLNASNYDKKTDIFNHCFNELTDIIPKVTNKNVLGIYYYVLGYYHLNKGEVFEGQKALTQAQETYRYIGDEDRVAALKVALGNVYLDQQDYQRVIKEVKEALETLTKRAINYNTLVALMMLITAYKYENRLKDGEYYYEIIKNNLPFIVNLKHPELLQNTADMAYLYTDMETIGVIEEAAKEIATDEKAGPYQKYKYALIKDIKNLNSINIEKRLESVDTLINYSKELGHKKYTAVHLISKIKILMHAYQISKDRQYLVALEENAEVLSKLIPQRANPQTWLLCNLITIYAYVFDNKYNSAKFILKLVGEITESKESAHIYKTYINFIAEVLDSQYKYNSWKEERLSLVEPGFYESFSGRQMISLNEQFLLSLFMELIRTTETVFEKGKGEYDEEPEIYALLTINNQGLSVYANIINQKISIDDQLFGGFISAINVFSSELIKPEEGEETALLRAINYKNWTLLINPIADFTTIIVAEDQSLELWEQLERFCDLIKNMSSEIKHEINLGIISEKSQAFFDECFNQVYMTEKE